jgi:hypothetical protein
VVDAESSQAFQTKLAGTKETVSVDVAESFEAEFGVPLEPQLTSTSNAVKTATRVNLCNTSVCDFIVSA